MGFMCFGVNNQRELYLIQERFDGAVTLKTYDGDEVENAIEISPGDFVMLVNHYRNCKETGHPIVLGSYEPESETSNLPDEFDFYSHVNPITKGQKYHAVRCSDPYVYRVSLQDSDNAWDISGKELAEHIDDGRYEIVL